MKNMSRHLLAFVMTSSFLSAQQTINVTFPHEDKTVYGCITVPPGPGPFPAIVIAPGSGAIDRDGTITMAGGNVQSGGMPRAAVRSA